MKRGKAPLHPSITQGRCAACNQWQKGWDKHILCPKCAVKRGQACSIVSPCGICSVWDSTQWSMYLNSVKDAKTPSPSAKRKVLQTPPSTPAPSNLGSFGFPSAPIGYVPGLHGPPYGYQPAASWTPMSDPDAYRAYLHRQLESLTPDPSRADMAAQLRLEELKRQEQLASREHPRSAEEAPAEPEAQRTPPRDPPDSPGQGPSQTAPTEPGEPHSFIYTIPHGGIPPSTVLTCTLICCSYHAGIRTGTRKGPGAGHR